MSAYQKAIRCDISGLVYHLLFLIMSKFLISETAYPNRQTNFKVAKSFWKKLRWSIALDFCQTHDSKSFKFQMLAELSLYEYEANFED